MILFSWVNTSTANSVCFSAPNQAPPSSSELPLCGNGILDQGEVCDDGNRIGGDGCNAWCSAFDAMNSACTLAGRNMACPFGKTVVGGGAPSKATFCNLRAIDVHPDGLYIVVADSSSLLKLSLFTDAIPTSLELFPVTIEKEFSPICSLSIMELDLSVLTYECNTMNRMRLSLVSFDGSSSVSLATFDDTLNMTTHDVPSKMYVHKNRRGAKAIIAGLAKSSAAASNSGFESCIRVFSVEVPSFMNASSSLPSERASWVKKIADISCIVYNVIDTEVVYPTFSLRGMLPKQVRYSSCPHVYLATSMCYEVQLQRYNDLQIVNAFIPETGGIDIVYYARTDFLDNVFLGDSIVKTNVDGTMQYSLHSNCLQAEHTVLSASGGGRLPPKITFGNACKNAPSLGMQCAMPLNNPFVTDIISSPYLLPDGLSSVLTHADLVQVFSQQTISAQNISVSGGMLYKNILKNLYGNSTPVDFVLLPNTMDIVYITPISISLISSKRFTLFDPNNPGYCRATDVIYCPSGFYGTVKHGVCHDCTNKTSPGHGTSLSWQVMCASLPSILKTQQQLQRRLLQTSATTSNGPTENDDDAPLEKFTMLLSRDVSEKQVYDAICLWFTTKGEACPPFQQNSMSPKQQYNMAADWADSGMLAPTSSFFTSGNGRSMPSTLITSLVRTAEERIGYSFRKAGVAEYMASWTSKGTKLVDSGALPDVPISQINVSNISLHSVNITRYLNNTLLRLCLYTKSKGFIRGWLECVLPLLTSSEFNNSSSSGSSSSSSSTGSSQSRRLLQTTDSTPQTQETSAVEYQGLTLLSSKRVQWNMQDLSPSPPPSDNNQDDNDTSKDEVEKFPLWVGAVIGVVCGIIVVFLLFFIYTRQSVRP